ncbi:MAG TPA: nicotinate-nucleotide adenylyltransferase [Lapidilactobacillus dextrinicus]|uniref:Probable nicotinate-nucleotide adenylyltransferase n=1 Tax=Lapidilactobacillus dextrinicus TaxID=51664 RepID=A0A921B250_9LACO|nr:nicotinate-nucleotide adenylyltransferase [Lapidilactobacillus dextrinicus]
MKQTELKTPLETKVQIKTPKLPRQAVGIMGGTFNPVHIGHLIMADQVMAQLKLKKVSFIPDAQPPHQDHKETIDAKDRVAMLELALAGHQGFDLDLLEIARGGKSYTYDTIVELKRRHPLADYYLILGADMIEYLPTWHRIDELAKLVTFVGIKRPGYSTKAKYPVIWVDTPEVAISSTKIRQLVSNHCPINYLVPDKVQAYIKEKGLYLEH